MATFFFTAGLILGLASSAGIEDLFAQDIAALEGLAELLTPLPQSSFLAMVLIKNISALSISLVLSPIFLLVPLIALTFNGGLIGLVSAAVIQQESLGYLLAGMLPHGIFELPALIMGEAVALSFGTAVILAIFKKEKRSQLLPNVKSNLRYLGIALALLVLAAIMETYVTPLFLS